MHTSFAIIDQARSRRFAIRSRKRVENMKVSHVVSNIFLTHAVLNTLLSPNALSYQIAIFDAAFLQSYFCYRILAEHNRSVSDANDLHNSRL
jgi:hypothetical protein